MKRKTKLGIAGVLAAASIAVSPGMANATLHGASCFPGGNSAFGRVEGQVTENGYYNDVNGALRVRIDQLKDIGYWTSPDMDYRMRVMGDDGTYYDTGQQQTGVDNGTYTYNTRAVTQRPYMNQHPRVVFDGGKNGDGIAMCQAVVWL